LQYVSNEFLSRHEDLHGQFVELKVDGKSWLVKLNYYLQGSRFYAGWRQFKEECKLKRGDICLFELIDEKKCVFKVSFVTKISWDVWVFLWYNVCKMEASITARTYREACKRVFVCCKRETKHTLMLGLVHYFFGFLLFALHFSLPPSWMDINAPAWVKSRTTGMFAS